MLSRLNLSLTHVLALAMAVAGCASHVRTYPTPDLPRDQVAILRSANYEFASIRRLDGVATLQLFGKLEFEITPGVHVIEVGYADGSWHSTTNAVILFEAHAARTYEVGAARIKEGFWSEFAKAAALHAESGWVAWVVDSQSNEVVGGVRVARSTFETDLDNVEYPRRQIRVTMEEP